MTYININTIDYKYTYIKRASVQLYIGCIVGIISFMIYEHMYSIIYYST